MEFAEIFGIFVIVATWGVTALTWAEVGRLTRSVNKQNDLFTEILNQCRIINGRKSEQESDTDA